MLFDFTIFVFCFCLITVCNLPARAQATMHSYFLLLGLFEGSDFLAFLIPTLSTLDCTWFEMDINYLSNVQRRLFSNHWSEETFVTWCVFSVCPKQVEGLNALSIHEQFLYGASQRNNSIIRMHRLRGTPDDKLIIRHDVPSPSTIRVVHRQQQPILNLSKILMIFHR